MNRRTDILARLADGLPRLCGFALLLVLPFGYYPDYPDSSQFEIGVGGGFGQVASIAGSCMTEHRDEANSFTDFSGSGFGRVRLGDRTDFIYGAQIDYFRGTARFTNSHAPHPFAHVDRWSFSPRIALESRYFGAGIGLTYGRIPYEYEWSSEWERAEWGPTFHLRAGSLRGFYLLGSLGENHPIVSGGGYFCLGLGYPISGNLRMYSAMSLAPYDQPGFLQQVDLSLSRKMALQLAMRAGEAEGIFEGALSASLVFRLGALGE